MGEESPGTALEGVAARVAAALPLLGSGLKNMAAFVFKLEKNCERRRHKLGVETQTHQLVHLQ
jgi:hypothetical protein